MSVFTYLLSMSGAWGQYFRFYPISRSPTMGNQPCETRLQQHQIAFPLKQISALSTPQYSDRLDRLNRSKFKYISFQPAVINMDVTQVEVTLR